MALWIYLDVEFEQKAGEEIGAEGDGSDSGDHQSRRDTESSEGQRF